MPAAIRATTPAEQTTALNRTLHARMATEGKI
jgi:hypothetical protein